MAAFPPLRAAALIKYPQTIAAPCFWTTIQLSAAQLDISKVAQSFFQAKMEQGLQHPGQCVPVNPCSRSSREKPLVSFANILNKHKICFLILQNLSGGFGFQKGVSDMEVPSLL